MALFGARAPVIDAAHQRERHRVAHGIHHVSIGDDTLEGIRQDWEFDFEAMEDMLNEPSAEDGVVDETMKTGEENV